MPHMPTPLNGTGLESILNAVILEFGFTNYLTSIRPSIIYSRD